jgi:DNA-binding transcriptional MerR regulator
MKTTPTYNLNVIVCETGIKPDTRRAWERGYELPQPSRTEGGHRLYSDRDILTIRWLNDRLHEGLRIKQAVDMWKEMESPGQDPLLDKPDRTQLGHVEHIGIGDGHALEDMRDAWVKAC